MNNDSLPRYAPSLNLNGNELPQFPELDDFPFNSYYNSSAQNVANNNNPNFYRPYEPVLNNNNEEWPFVNNVAGVFGNRNEEWPQFPEPNYPQYAPTYPNVNYWPHLYFQHNEFPAQNNVDTPPVSSGIDLPHHHYPPNLPLRPIPQQAVGDTSHQCKACYRFCASAGGLKRHAKFCRASQENLEAIFASLKRQQPEIVPDVANNNYDTLPMNLSCAEPMVQPNTQPIPIVPDIDQNVPKRARIASDDSTSTRKRACPECPLVLVSERALVEHLASHNVAKPYECVTCGSRFSRKFHLTRHVKQRGCDGTPRAQFPCDYCGKFFSRKDNLREHVKSHTGQSRPRAKLPCPIPSCKKEFQGRTQLQVHLNLHAGLRPYACDRDGCEKTFRSNAALRKHLRLHNSQQPFQCPQCDARFPAKEMLAHHMVTHDLLKPIKSYLCSRCGMAFIHQTQLREHMAVHQSNEMFTCAACGRKYKRRWRLQQHYRSEHVEKRVKIPEPVPIDSLPEQPYNCDICTKAFFSKHSLKLHQMTHAEPPVNCSECSRSYIRRDCLLRHLRTKHHLLPDEALQKLENLTKKVDDPPEPFTGSITSQLNTEVNEVATLESNIIELLSLLVDPNALRNFGWPESGVDVVLQAVLMKCGKEPFSNPSLPLPQRLRNNTRMLFSFIVDDQTALETLFARRPVEQVLQQVIQLAKSNESSDNVLQLPI